MSKLVEKLESLAEGKAQPMGFAAAVARAKTAPMLLIASLTGPALDTTGPDMAGADAVLVTIGDVSELEGSLAEKVKGLGDMPWGVSLRSVSGEGVKQLADLGCDFVIFDAAQSPPLLLQEEDMGKVIALDPSLSDSLLRAMERLPVDAVFVAEGSEGPALSVYHLLVYQRLASLVRHPLLTPAPAELGKGDMEGLLEAGVRGVVVELAKKRSVGKLAELRRAIDSLPTARKRRGKVDVLLPRLAESRELPEAEEEEEEE